MIGYDELFEALRRERAWGILTAQIKDGEVVQLKLERGWKSVQDALRDLARPKPAEAGAKTD